MSIRATTTLGGTASNITVGKVAVCIYVALHPKFFLTSPLPAWIDDDDVRFSLDIALDQVQIDHVDGRPSQSQTNSVLRQSRQAWTPFLLEQRCSSTEVGQNFRHKTY